MTAQRLGRYELLEQLGEGGMGAVWLARLTGTGGFEKLCIVKTVLPAIAKDAGFVSRFLHEGKVLTQLQHSNIAQVFDMGDDGGQLYLALEYVPGLDISHLHAAAQARGERLPVPLAIFIAQQAAEGLAFAHGKTLADGSALSLVHRDVTPQNLMVSWDGEVKVIDFGIARSEAKSHATATQSVLGKLGYMAPEQARGEPLDHRADQYALAITLWELLADQPFIPRGTLTEMVVAMTNAKPRALVSLRPEVPPSVEATVLKALSPDRNQRYPTTDDFARALSDELVRLGTLPTRKQVGEYVRSYCGAEFQKHQALLTRISAVRGTAPMPLTTPAPPQSTAEMQASLRPSRMPLVIGGVVVAMLLGAGAFFGLRSTPTEPARELVMPSTTAEIYVDGDKTYVRAGQNLGLRVGESLTVLGAEHDDGRRPKLGSADVLEVFPELARVRVDASVASTKGVRVVALESSHVPPPQPVKPVEAVDAAVAEVPKPTPPPEPAVVDAGVVAQVPPPAPGPVVAPPVKTEPAKPAAPRVAKLSGSVQLQRTPVWSVYLTNTSKIGWSNCIVYAPGNRRADVKVLPASMTRELPLAVFHTDPSAPPLESDIEVRCQQGTALIPARE